MSKCYSNQRELQRRFCMPEQIKRIFVFDFEGTLSEIVPEKDTGKSEISLQNCRIPLNPDCVFPHPGLRLLKRLPIMFLNQRCCYAHLKHFRVREVKKN